MIKKFRHYFFAGILILTPMVLTFYILKALLDAAGSILSPFFDYLFGVHIPGIGLVTLLVIVVVSGIVAENVIGKKIFEWWDALLKKMPLVHNLYQPIKQIFSAFSNKDGKSKFSRVVLVEYPKAGSFAIGFVTNELEGKITERFEKKMLSCFVPTTPNPTSGFLLIVPLNEVIPLSISVEEGIRFVISGGISDTL